MSDRDNHDAGLAERIAARLHADQRTRLGVYDRRTNTNTTTGMCRKLCNLRSLTVAKFADNKDTRPFFYYVHADNPITRTESDATYASGHTAHRSSILFVESNCLAL